MVYFAIYGTFQSMRQFPLITHLGKINKLIIELCIVPDTISHKLFKGTLKCIGGKNYYLQPTNKKPTPLPYRLMCLHLFHLHSIQPSYTNWLQSQSVCVCVTHNKLHHQVVTRE